MFTVSLIGPDGAGKTTIGRRLESSFELPVKYLYMGVNADASNVLLPTTRLARAIKRHLRARPDTAGPRDLAAELAAPSGGSVWRAASAIKGMLGLANRIAEELFRQWIAWGYQRRGSIVVFDRHFFADYYSYDIAPGSRDRPLASRLHGLFLNHLYPRPDLVIYLDAPGAVLFARKGEGSVELLERRRQDYLQLRGHVKQFAVVDASESPARVLDAVGDVIRSYQNAHTAERRFRKVKS